MPELPEVETIRKQLTEVLVGEEIAGVEVRKDKVYRGDRQVRGAVTKVTRRGKYLFIHLGAQGLAIHLKMTGRLVWDREWYESAPHTRVVVRLASGRSLYYWDTRMFGYLHHVKDVNEAEEKVKKKLGPEPEEIGEEDFVVKLQKTGRAIKDVLLDQHILAGVGNIYANDGLWEAGIDPHKRAKQLTRRECKLLLTAMRKVLTRGLITGGASDNSYVDARGQKGSYQKEFRVYKGGKCRRCGRELKYGKVGGRGTWWCEECQR